MIKLNDLKLNLVLTEGEHKLKLTTPRLPVQFGLTQKCILIRLLCQPDILTPS